MSPNDHDLHLHTGDTDASLSTLVGERIRFYRKQQRLSLEALAKLIHKSKGTLSKYESGVITIDIVTLFEIQKVLNIDITHFLPPGKGNIPQMMGIFFDKDKDIYMYHMTNRTVHMSVIKLCQDTQTQAVNAMLYYIVDNPKDLESCDCVYRGTLNSSYTMATFLLSNQFNPFESAMITLTASLKKQDYYLGFLTGINFDNLKPSVLKIAVTQNPAAQGSLALKKYLVFSKQDAQTLKAKSYLTISDN